MRFTFKDLPPEDAEKYLDIKIQRIDNGPGRCTVKIWRGKQSKPFVYYSFKTPEKREEYITKSKEDAKSIHDYKEKQKAEKIEANAEMVNPFKNGDIVSNSWGYDQTNVDFYQVVEVGPKSVKLRSIGCESIPGSEGFMSCQVVPVKDNFLKTSTHEGKHKEGNPPFLKRLKAYKDRNGKVQIYIHWKHGGGGKFTGGSLYNSWYA